MTKQRKLILTVEKEGRTLWGWIKIGNNFIFDHASTLPILEKRLKKFLKDVVGISNVKFTIKYI